MLYKELVYMVLDEAKQMSDDSHFTEDHVIFLADKYRALYIKKEYYAKKKAIPSIYYQTICVDLEKVSMFGDTPCVGGVYLRSVQQLPELSEMAVARVDTIDYFTGNIAYVSPERFKYAGSQSWMKNFIYATEAWDRYLYLKSNNSQYLNLKKVKVTGIFEDSAKAAEYSCEPDGSPAKCDILESEFKCEGYMIPIIIQSIVKELLGVLYMPKDRTNNSEEELSGLNVKLGKSKLEQLAES